MGPRDVPQRYKTPLHLSHPLAGCTFQGLSPTLRPATTKKKNNASTSTINLSTSMPRNKVSNDLDHVKKDPKPSKTPKGPPPSPWPLPKYTPVDIKKPWTNGISQLPDIIAPDNPYTIFNLFFNDQVIEILVRHINLYTFLDISLKNTKKPGSRP